MTESGAIRVYNIDGPDWGKTRRTKYRRCLLRIKINSQELDERKPIYRLGELLFSPLFLVQFSSVECS